KISDRPNDMCWLPSEGKGHPSPSLSGDVVHEKRIIGQREHNGLPDAAPKAIVGVYESGVVQHERGSRQGSVVCECYVTARSSAFQLVLDEGSRVSLGDILNF